MGEPSDPRREMEACRRASIEPATKQANRGGGTGAVGGSHGDRRADPESGSCRHAASADRASGPAAACLLFGGGFCVCENTLGWEVSASQRHRNRRRQPEPQQAAQRCCCLAAARTNIGEYKRSSVLAPLDTTPSLYLSPQGRSEAQPIPRTPSAASTRHRRRPLVVPTAGGAEAGK